MLRNQEEFSSLRSVTSPLPRSTASFPAMPGLLLLGLYLILPQLGANACLHRDVDIEISSRRLDWRLCNRKSLENKGINATLVSSKEFEHSDAYTRGCFAATAVPGTVLTNMVQNNMFDGITDLFVDDNLERVPDISDVGIDYYTFYWRTSFNLSALGFTSSDCDIRLKLRSLNYRGTVFCNGREIIPENLIEGESAAVGMFHRWTYILSQGIKPSSETDSQGETFQNISNDTITIAILIKPPDFPGKVTGGQGGDHDIAKNAAIQQSTAGWDWIRGTPDRNTGLWDRVSLEFADPWISIHDDVHVQILSNITSRYPDHVDIGVTVDVIHKKELPMDCLTEENFVIFDVLVSGIPTFSFNYTLDALACESKLGEKCKTNIGLSPIRIFKPTTWWPHNYGNPYLYHATVQVRSPCLPTVYSKKKVNFGVRSFSSYVDPLTDGRVFICNGQRIFLQGGNWVGTDQFLRYSTSKARYRNEVKLHKSMGLNVIRVWGGSITERPEFFEATDTEGVLVIQEFWMTGDNNGRWAGSYNYPLDHNVYLSCAQDVILMLRNQASLLLWVGGNELYPERQSPPKDIASRLFPLIKNLDPGRCSIASSMSNYTNFDPSFALAPKDGPYGFLSPSRFYQRNPGLRFWNGTLASSLKIGFQPEIGSSGTPNYREISLFLTKSYAEQFPSKNDETIPRMFRHHNYLSYTDDLGWDHIHDAYGSPTNMSEYCFQAQLAQYTQFKGLFEGFQRHMWTYYTAILFWKTQSPWPSFRGFTYSWWLEQTGGFYGIRAALEGGQPLHVQLGNWTTETSICIINRSPQVYEKITFVLACEWWDLNGTMLTSKSYTVDGSKLEPNSVYSVKTEDLEFPMSVSLGIAYLRIVLSSPEDPSACLLGKYNTIYRSPVGCSFNEYYMSDPEKNQSFSSLGDLRRQPSKLLRLNVQCLQLFDSQLAIQVTNPNTAIVLQARIRVDDTRKKFFYSDQYFSLLPKEGRNLTITEMFVDGATYTNRSDNVLLLIDGINIRPQRHTCEMYSANTASQLR